MHSFFLAMLLHPEVQVRARHEIEAVLGVHHLPTFEDFGTVPYIDALIKELLRWQPVVRLSKSGNIEWTDVRLGSYNFLVDIPHKLREDDIYNGYHLEKGSLVIVNTW